MIKRYIIHAQKRCTTELWYTSRAPPSLSVRCKSAHATCKIQRSGRRYATWRIHISRVLNERCTAVLCAIAAQPSAAPQRGSIADRPTAIYGVKRLPGEAAWLKTYQCVQESSRNVMRVRVWAETLVIQGVLFGVTTVAGMLQAWRYTYRTAWCSMEDEMESSTESASASRLRA